MMCTEAVTTATQSVAYSVSQVRPRPCHVYRALLFGAPNARVQSVSAALGVGSCIVL